MEIKGKILLVEDDYYFGETIRKRLEEHGFAVTFAGDGEVAWIKFQAQRYDLCLLDVVMPKKNGFELAGLIKKRSPSVPVIFITSKTQDEDVIAGFAAGADGYLKKPFSMQELVLRIEVFLKRSRPLNADKTDIYKIGPITFNYSELLLTDKVGNHVGRPITQREADLLKYLCENANKLLTRNDILFHVWGNNDYFLGRSMDVFIHKIRRRLRSVPEVELLTVHGHGFKLEVKKG